MTAIAEKQKAVARHAPVDLAIIKDDLQMPAGDTSDDAWLQRRIDGLWARFEVYTARPLQLSTGWVDDWGELVSVSTAVQPPLIAAAPGATAFLRVFPVQSITRLTFNGADQD